MGIPVSPLSLLKNPMILIAGFGMLMVFGMPYLLENSEFLDLLYEFQKEAKENRTNLVI
jgi:hypothetical protein